MIKDLIYELSVSEQSETGALGIALTSRERERERERAWSGPDIPEAQLSNAVQLAEGQLLWAKALP